MEVLELAKDLERAHAVVAHNIAFDMSVLKSELLRANRKDLIAILDSKQHVCTMVEAVKLSRNVRLPKLETSRFAQKRNMVHFTELMLMYNAAQISTGTKQTYFWKASQTIKPPSKMFNTIMV